MTDLEARLLAELDRVFPAWAGTGKANVCSALAAVVQGMLAEQAREIERLTTILHDVLADANMGHQQITRLEGNVERLREGLEALVRAVTTVDVHAYPVSIGQARAALRQTPGAP